MSEDRADRNRLMRGPLPEYAEGGHFAAAEQPDLFLADVRKFFRDYRG